MLAPGRRGVLLVPLAVGLSGCGGITTNDFGEAEGGSGGGVVEAPSGGFPSWGGSGGSQVVVGGQGGGDPVACPAGLSPCGEECTDLATDKDNCGVCGHQCGELAVCTAGLCTADCLPPLVNCWGSCIDPLSDSAHCGAGPDCDWFPGAQCTPDETCLDGICTYVFSCPLPLVDCFGTCIDPSYDQQYCGAGPDCYLDPGRACGPEEMCVDGACERIFECPPELIDCFGTCIDPRHDQQFCGAGPDCYDNPGRVCGPDQMCFEGTCVSILCPPPLVDCYGMCIDPSYDQQHCGAGPDCYDNPGRACGPDEECMDGICMPIFICPPELVDCHGRCVDPWSDPEFCGAGPDCEVNPGEDCSAVGLECIEGRCTLLCPVGSTNCGNECVDIGTDISNCGGCGIVCMAGQACVGGTCITPGTDCTNIAPRATCTHNGGGSGEYGPAQAIDGVGESSCAMSWVDSPTYANGDYWQLTWDEPVIIGSMFVDADSATSPTCGYPTGRDILYAEVQWWDGQQWITDGTLRGQEDYPYAFSEPVVTSQIRLYDVYSTDIGNHGNAILYEWYVYSGNACPEPDDA